MKKIYLLPVKEVASALKTNENSGLNPIEAKNRLAEFGRNQLAEKKKGSAFGLFLEQFQDFIVWVLIGAAIISGFLREWVDALAIVAVVITNAVLGFIQEYRAEKTLAALKKLSSPTAKVIRNGQLAVIPAFELVPGDLIELEAGDNIPADSRLTYVSLNFACQEASLTGESLPVEKTSLELQEADVPLAERANMVYMGTCVVSGRGRAMVVDTGMKTELGKIASLIQEIKEEATPLQKKLEQFGKWLVYLCFVLVAAVFLMEMARGGEMVEMFLTAVSLAVAAIPEGLPAIVTIALALGVQRMVKRHALIRRLPSVETLGSTTVICSDKTGTLTKNEMTVKAVYTADNELIEVTGIGYEPKGDFLIGNEKMDIKAFPALEKILVCGALCNNAELAQINGVYKIVGDPTEGAILTAAAKAGFWKKDLAAETPFIEEIPFDSVRKRMTVIRKSKNSVISFTKGAPEAVLVDCPGLSEAEKEKIKQINLELADKAMRVLAFAYKELPEIPRQSEAAIVETGLTFLGLMAMIDPPREEAKAAVVKCKSAGIKTVMITGDQENTARAIGRELGIDLVYARVSPEDKIRIVRDLRAQGEIVAMTGDGVNDAPALKEADIGIAMGITGTDVTKEASDMVITDDNFASIVSAVEEGRGIYDNIRKSIHFLLSCNAGEILVMFTASLIGLPVPLLPIHILWVNLVTDGLPALALGVEPVDPNIMKVPPRDPKEWIVTTRRGLVMLLQGGFIALCSLLAFAFVLYVEGEGLARARTAAFVVLACSQLFHVYNCRSMSESVFKIGFFSNVKLNLANTISFLMMIAVVYLPFFHVIFKTEPLHPIDWLIVVTISSFPLWAMEITKRLFERRPGLYQTN